MTLPQAFDLALPHHQAGRLAEAEAIYRQILAVEPQHVEALHFMGVIAHQVGRNEAAVELMQQALAHFPDHPACLSNLGGVYRALGRLDAAVAAYRRALALDPHLPQVHQNLGNVLRDQGRVEDAIAAYRGALALAPDSAETHASLGAALARAGRLEDASAAYRRALQLRPDYAEAHNNLGAVLRDRGDLEGAAAACRQALHFRPEFAPAHTNLGNALKGLGQLDEAIAAYRRALQAQPDDALAHHNLGNALKDHGQLDDAIAAYRRALELRPDLPEAHSNLGPALSERGEFAAAVAACRRAIELQPELAEAHYNLGHALSEQGQFELAVAAYRHALQLQPDYTAARNNLANALKDQGRVGEAIAEYRRVFECDPADSKAHSNLLFALHYPAHPDRDALFAEHCRWEECHARPLAKFIAGHTNDPAPGRRLRIGYVSPDFREHSVACFFEALLASHDPAQVEVFCYDDVLRADAVTARLRERAGHWRRIHGLSDEAVAKIIRADGIDILVDLAGHTARHRLLVFARKPAPVQVTWLGYGDTTGLRAMDFRLTDAHADPLGMTEHLHTEQLVRLPECAWCYRPLEQSPPVGDPPVGRSGRITFGCFNVRPKITAEALALWSRLLRAAPDSRLLLKLAGVQDAAARERLRGLLAAAGLDAERVELMERVPTLAEHLACYGRVDLALDTFPYHGTTTTCEALWMGVPVVTLAGQTHASRVGVSLLTNVGLPELIAQDQDDYLRIAVNLAADRTRLADLRATLRARMAASPLRDAPRFARHVEAAYREMWRQWCAGRSTA